MCEPKALIVEDEIFVALDLERILEGKGFEIVGIAADRAEAIRLAADCTIAFVDVNLRDGATGPEIARELATKGVRVVFVTANPSQIDAEELRGTCCVRKPFAEETILSAATLAMTDGPDVPMPGIIRL